jgi:ADP-ribose pyrophosphatase YjhB (NUDIX family)
LIIENFRRVAIAFILNKTQDKILVCTRRNSTDWGLVGGKVDEGEDEITALNREIEEEVGVKLFKDAVPIFTGLLKNDGAWYSATVFFVTGVNSDDVKQCEDGIIPIWKTFEEFQSKEGNVFKSFNDSAFNAYVSRAILNGNTTDALENFSEKFNYDDFEKFYRVNVFVYS